MSHCCRSTSNPPSDRSAGTISARLPRAVFLAPLGLGTIACLVFTLAGCALTPVITPSRGDRPNPLSTVGPAPDSPAAPPVEQRSTSTSDEPERRVPREFSDSLRCEALPGVVEDVLASHLTHHRLDTSLRRIVVERFHRDLVSEFEGLLSSSDIAWIGRHGAMITGAEASSAFAHGDCAAFATALRFVRSAYRTAIDSMPPRDALRAKVAGETIGAIVQGTGAKRLIGRIEFGHRMVRSLVRIAAPWVRTAGLDGAARFAVARAMRELDKLEGGLELSIEDRVVSAFLSALDAHSYYVPRERADAHTQEYFRRTSSGVGIALDDDPTPFGVRISRLLRGGPAERSGKVQVGDHIVAIEGQVTIGVEPDGVEELLAGESGDPVTIQLARLGPDDTVRYHEVVIARGDISRASRDLGSRRFEVGGTRILDIRIAGFYPGVGADLRRTLRSHLHEGALDVVVLDLRGNPGGILSEALDVVGAFVFSGPLLIEHHRHGTTTLRDEDAEVAYGGPLVVVVDGHSASAAEIVAGSLKDLGRALLVGGPRTYGKGTIQTSRDISTGGIAVFTTGQYFFPSGSPCQKEGVATDITVPGVRALSDGSGEGALRGAIGTSVRVKSVMKHMHRMRSPEVIAELTSSSRGWLLGMSAKPDQVEQLSAIHRLASDYSRLLALASRR